MERKIGAVFRCITCKLSLDGQAASDEHEKKHGHKVKRTEIIISPPRINSAGGFDLKCIVAGAPGSAPQGARSSRPSPQTMLVLTAGGQLVRQRVTALQGQLIGAPNQALARVSNSRPVFFLSNASGAQGLPQPVPMAITETTVEATVEPNQDSINQDNQDDSGTTVEREEGMQQEGTEERNETAEGPQEASNSNGTLELLTQPQLEFLRKYSQKPGGGKTPGNKRVLGPARSNPRNNNQGNGTKL